MHEHAIPWDWMPLLWTTAQAVAGSADPVKIANALPGALVVLRQTMEEMAACPREVPMSPGWVMTYDVGSGSFVLRSDHAPSSREGSALTSLRIVK